MFAVTACVTASSFGVTAAVAAAAPDLPDHNRTPGAADRSITQANYRGILCRGPGGTRLHTTDERRPNSSYTTNLKRKQLGELGYTDRRLGDYEEDHLISIELGGDPAAEDNLWPEHYSGDWGARTKDTLEAELGRRICLPASATDYVTLAEARGAVSEDWITAYKKYVCNRTPKLTPLMMAHCRLP